MGNQIIDSRYLHLEGAFLDVNCTYLPRYTNPSRFFVQHVRFKQLKRHLGLLFYIVPSRNYNKRSHVEQLRLLHMHFKQLKRHLGVLFYIVPSRNNNKRSQFEQLRLLHMHFKQLKRHLGVLFYIVPSRNNNKRSHVEQLRLLHRVETKLCTYYRSNLA